MSAFWRFNSDVAKAVIKMKVCMEGLHMVRKILIERECWSMLIVLN